MERSMVIKNGLLVLACWLIVLLFLSFGGSFFFVSFFVPVVVNCVGVPICFSSKKERFLSSAVITVASVILFLLYTVFNYHFGFLDNGGVAAVFAFSLLITVIPSVLIFLLFFLAFKRSGKE